MTWATFSSRSCVWGLYTASPPSATKNVINLISVLTIWWCPYEKLFPLLVKEYLLWLVHSLGRIQLAFVLLYSVAYFIPDSLYLLIPYLYFALPSIPFPTGNYQFVLYICDFASFVLYSLVFFFFKLDSTYKWSNIVFVILCLIYTFNLPYFIIIIAISSVQFSRSIMSNSATPWTAAHQASLSITNSQSLPKLMSIESVMPSNRLILCCPLLLLPSIFPRIRVFSNESAFCISWPKYWTFSFNVSLFNEHPGLISFRMDWLGLLAIQGTLKSFLQPHSSKASILWHSAFFIVQLSYPCMIHIALTRWIFVSKVVSAF